MKRLLFILVIGIVLASCNGWQRVPDKEKTHTVFVTEIGNLTVNGEIDYLPDGRVEFTDVNGRTFNTHISRCVIVEPALPAQVTQQPQRPEAEENKPDENPQKE